VPDLLSTLCDGDDDVRHAALEILGNLKDERAVVAVAELLGLEGDRGKAADCLKRMGRMAEETVLRGLEHPDPKVVNACCEVLAEVGSEKCLDALERLTDHRDWSIRGAAKQAGRTIVAQRPR
jgi:HEAT repeat protein